MYNPEDIIWLLVTIKYKRDRDERTTTRDIFRGCYDVWSCEQDKIDAIEIPKRRLAEAKTLGLIDDFPNPKNEKWLPYWKLTETGEKYFVEHWK